MRRGASPSWLQGLLKRPGLAHDLASCLPGSPDPWRFQTRLSGSCRRRMQPSEHSELRLQPSFINISVPGMLERSWFNRSKPPDQSAGDAAEEDGLAGGLVIHKLGCNKIEVSVLKVSAHAKGEVPAEGRVQAAAKDG